MAFMTATALETPPFTPPTVKPPATFWQQVLALRHAFSNQIRVWPESAYEASWWRPAPGMPVFIMDPDLIGEVFLRQWETFHHGGLLRRMVGPIWGKGIFTTDGPEWKWQRQTAAPAFRPDRLGALVPAFAAKTEEMIQRWEARILGRGGRRVDLVDEFSNLTREVVLDTILGGGDDFRTPQVHDQLKVMIGELSRMRLSFFLMPDQWHVGRPGLFSEGLNDLKAQVRRMVAARRSAPPRGDLVTLMMQATDPETGEAMGDDLLADNLMGFIAAGQDTSAIALTWSVYLAFEHAPTLARIREEVAQVAGAQPIGEAHAPQLKFTRQVIQEAMRLYPTAALTRVALEDAQIGDLKISKGERVLIPLHILHRHRKLWDRPDVFDPDRWGEGRPPPPRHAYLPFGAGPRICIGSAFAMMEMTTVLATLARACDFTHDPTHKVVAPYGPSPRPIGGMPMDVTLREG